MRIFTSIRVKLMISILCAFILVVTSLLGITIVSLNTYFQAESSSQLKKNIASFDTLLTNYKDQALAQAQNIAVNPSVIEEVEKKDFQSLLAVSAPLMEQGKLDYMVFTDSAGMVILRTHEPEKIPAADDSIANQVNVSQAMAGTPFVGIEEGKVVKLSVRAGVPIYNSSGKMVGVVSTGYTISQNIIVDRAKVMIGSDFSIFFDQQPVATTLVDSSGTRLSEDFISETSLISTTDSQELKIDRSNIAGQEYVSGYYSVIGADSKPICVVSSSIPTATQEALKTGIINKILVPSLVIILLVFLLGFYISKKITDIVLSLQKNLFLAGRGNLTVHCSNNSNDEIGILKSSFNSMVDQQAEMITYIKDSSQRLFTSAEELASTSNQMTSAVTNIAESIQNVSFQSNEGREAAIEVSNVLTDFSVLIGRAKSLTEATQENSQTALHAAEQGKVVISETKERISLIDLKTQETEKQIAALKEHSEKIAVISDTINNLASQTNLLSLNASIEAARAGEAGKAFSVVANQVKRLAEQSTAGANEVAALIKKILETIDAAVSSTYESKKEAEAGVETIHQAEDSFDRILSAVEATSQDVNHIVEITKEETEDTENIIQSMQSVTEIMETMAKNAQEVAAATEEISASMVEVNQNTKSTSHLAETLQGKVQEFTIKPNSQLSELELLEKVKDDHNLFVIMISNMLKGSVEVSPADLTTHETCRFGKWYYQSIDKYKNVNLFKAMEEPHRLLHEYAHIAAEAYNKGNIRQAKKAYTKLEKSSCHIMKLFNRISRKYIAKNDK